MGDSGGVIETRRQLTTLIAAIVLLLTTVLAVAEASVGLTGSTTKIVNCSTTAARSPETSPSASPFVCSDRNQVPKRVAAPTRKAEAA